MSASSGRLCRMAEFFSLITQVAATLRVAYVMLVGPRRNADRFARALETLSAVLMAYVWLPRWPLLCQDRPVERLGDR